jgi:hypothetical protein
MSITPLVKRFGLIAMIIGLIDLQALKALPTPSQLYLYAHRYHRYRAYTDKQTLGALKAR